MGIILNVVKGGGSESVVSFINVYLIDGFLDVAGKLFINSIRMLVVPLVLVSLICGVAGIGDIKKLGRVGGKTLFFYLITTAMAVTLALIVASFINPGAGLNLDINTTAVAAKDAPSLSQVIINIVPSNPFTAMVEGEMLQVIFFAMLIGIAIAAVGKKVAGTLALFEELNAIVMKMISLIMLVAPFGIFCLIAKVLPRRALPRFCLCLST